jgi:putative two-component system response regulator
MEVEATILLVDNVDINRQFLRGMFKTCPYRLLEARRPSEALELLARHPVDLIIAELLMPETGGLEFCRRVKSNRVTRLVPILIVSSAHGIENEIAGLDSGADEFLIKPLQPAAVRTRVRAMLRNKRATDSLEEAETILFALAQAVEQRDKETGNHCQRLAALSVALGIALGLGEEDLQALYRGGYLHDIGKISVPDAILFKPGPLDEAEWRLMRVHPLQGEEICRQMRTLAPVLPIIRNHHERWDGSGYPDGLAGENIPLLARILQLADIYDALISSRSYKPAYSADRAMAIIQQEALKGWRDPELVSVFNEVLCRPGVLDDTASLCTSIGDSAAFAEPDDTSIALQHLRRELLK